MYSSNSVTEPQVRLEGKKLHLQYSTTTSHRIIICPVRTDDRYELGFEPETVGVVGRDIATVRYKQEFDKSGPYLS